MPDVLLHETVAAWIKRYFQMYPVAKDKGLDDNRASIVAGLQSCEKYINSNYDVASLCRALPRRIAKMIQEKGDRINH